MRHKHARTATERLNYEKEHGVRYTVLTTLPYYDTIRFCMVDPMHNLLLGSAKTFVKLWKKNVPESCFVNLQQLVDTFVTPVGIGRIPRKVGKSFPTSKLSN